MWKTWQFSLNGDLTLFSGTWPQAGILVNGSCFLWAQLVLRTAGTESSSLPTPTTDSVNSRSKRYAQGGMPLSLFARMYPTPTASDATTGAIFGKEDAFYQTPSGVPRKVTRTGVDAYIGLARFVKLFPNTQAETDRGGSTSSDEQLVISSGVLSAEWTEWLMAFPSGWTMLSTKDLLRVWERRKLLKSRRGRGKKESKVLATPSCPSLPSS